MIIELLNITYMFFKQTDLITYKPDLKVLRNAHSKH